MSDRREDVRYELALASRMLANEGVLDAFGHVSLRHPGDPSSFGTTQCISARSCSGVCASLSIISSGTLGHYSLIAPADMNSSRKIVFTRPSAPSDHAYLPIASARN